MGWLRVSVSVRIGVRVRVRVRFGNLAKVDGSFCGRMEN